jgi:hypothetical protein
MPVSCSKVPCVYQGFFFYFKKSALKLICPLIIDYTQARLLLLNLLWDQVVHLPDTHNENTPHKCYSLRYRFIMRTKVAKEKES